MNTLEIDATYPVTGDGTITDVSLYVQTAGNFRIGFFENVGVGVYRCRVSFDAGYLPVGQADFGGLEIPVKAGDCIGWYSTVGRLELTTGLGGGYTTFYKSAEDFDNGSFHGVNTQTGYAYSIAATGTDAITPPNQEEVDAIMDTVLTDYMPAVNAWIDNNWQGLTQFTLLLAEIIYLLENGGGGTGGGVTEAQVETIVQTAIANLETILATDVGLIREDIGVVSAPATGLLAALITHDDTVKSAIENAKDDIMDQVYNRGTDVINAIDDPTDAINAHTDTTVGNAVTTISGEIDEAVATIDAHTTSAVSAVNGWLSTAVSTVTAWVTSAKDAILADIAGHVAEILAALAGLGGGNTYPGDDSVTLGTEVSFTGSVRITAQAHGPGGKMDGILLTWTTVPQTKGKEEVNGIANWKYLGWLVFESTARWADRLQWLGPSKCAYLPVQLTSPGAVVISARDGAQGTARPFVVN